MLSKDTNRSLVADVQMKNTQLFGTHAATMGNLKTAPIASASFKKNAAPCAKHAAIPTAKLSTPQMSIGMSYQNSQPLSMKMSSNVAFKSQAASTNFFGSPAQAPAFTPSAAMPK
jgi:hypothetical protein